MAVHPAAAPDDGVHRPDRRRVAVDEVEVAHDIGFERYRDREPLCGKEGGEADDGACVRPLEASVVVTHPKARKEPVVEERALAVGAGVAGDGAHHETRVAVDHIPDIRKSEPFEEGIPLALLVPGYAGLPEDHVRHLTRRAPPGIDADVGRTDVCLPPCGEERLHLLCRWEVRQPRPVASGDPFLDDVGRGREEEDPAAPPQVRDVCRVKDHPAAGADDALRVPERRDHLPLEGPEVCLTVPPEYIRDRDPRPALDQGVGIEERQREPFGEEPPDRRLSGPPETDEDDLHSSPCP
ncbi:MAG: hypothetical protein BWX50_01653 [Euryarchaeota archaeon ADurb.Bin009]|nr:MAG: hypothetical protein BWX50_01653 [Euryarchaeota archaeon ADurb.Bin009]